MFVWAHARDAEVGPISCSGMLGLMRAFVACGRSGGATVDRSL